ncbi:hypothetical protein ACFX2I_014763 [Malus domestica]
MEEEPSQRNFVNPLFPLSNRSSTPAVSDLCTEVEEKVVEAAEIRVECGGGGKGGEHERDPYQRRIYRGT